MTTTTDASNNGYIEGVSRRGAEDMAFGASVLALRLGQPIDLAGIEQHCHPRWRGAFAVLRQIAAAGDRPTEPVMRKYFRAGDYGLAMTAVRSAEGMHDHAADLVAQLRQAPAATGGCLVRVTHTNYAPPDFGSKPKPVRVMGTTLPPRASLELRITNPVEMLQWNAKSRGERASVKVEVLEGEPPRLPRIQAGPSADQIRRARAIVARG